jgi:hypothetical protein
LSLAFNQKSQLQYVVSRKAYRTIYLNVLLEGVLAPPPPQRERDSTATEVVAPGNERSVEDERILM